ncbi:MAG: PAS domain S-box protein, partial [Bacteroidetes bacterium]
HHMENGDIVWDGIAQDITERRVAEERLHQQTVESRFLADASAQLAGCVTEAAVYSVISSMFTTYVPGSLVFVLKTLENGSRSRLVEIGGIRLEVLEAGKRLLRFDPVGRTFENREGFYEKYCRPTLQEMSGGLYEASSGVVPKSIARRIERLLGVSHVYTAGIAEGTSYVGYIDLMTPAALPLQRSTVESFLHQCYLALSAIAGRERANDEEVRRRFHFENVIDGIVVLDEDRRVVEANRRFADLLGYTAEEILTKHAWDWDVLFPTREAFERQWPSLPPTSGIIETQHRRRDGGIIDIEVVWNPVVWNGRRCLYCLCRDITERRVASERLQQELQRRRIVMDTTADGICVFDRDHRVIDCNRRMCELLGYDRDALLQLYAWDIDAVETRERIQSMFADAASQNRTFETRQRRRDGSVYDAEISIRRTSIGGEPVVVTGTRDITERKRLDRALKESQDRFQRYVEHAHVIITIIDSAGRVEYINRTESGVPVEGFIGRNIFDVILPDHVGEVRRRIREARESGGAQSYITSAMVEGRQAWYQNRVAPFGDDDRFLITSLNITDLKAAEESLRRSEERFRNLVNRIPQRVFVKDVDSVYVSGNEAFASDLGVPPSEIAGRTDLDFFPAPLAEQYRSDDRRVIGRAAPLDREEEYILRGERRTILTTKVPMFNPDGTVSGVLGIFTDITERKAMERNVAESELRYRTLFETMAQGVVYQNAAGSVSSANPAALRILGLSLEQILGRTSMDPRWHAVRENGDPFPGEEHPAMAALRTGRPVPDTVMGVFRPDLNAYVWIVINAVPLFGPDGRTPVEVFSTLEDVTTRKRFETELRNSEERYRTVAQYTYDWEMWIGNDGTIRYISPSCERITGYTAEEITRNPSRLVSMIHPDDRDDYRRHVEDEFRDASVHAFEMRIITRSGAERWVQHLCRPIVTQDGRNLGRRVSNRDITERKMDERRLQESEERYRGIVENIHQAYYEANGRAVFTYCNPGLVILSGYSAEELYDMSSFRLVHEEDRPRVME